MNEKDPRDTESPEFIDRLTDEGFEPVEPTPGMEYPFEDDVHDPADDDDEIVFPDPHLPDTASPAEGKTLEEVMDELLAIDHYPGQDGSGWAEKRAAEDPDAPLFPEDAEGYVAPDIDDVIDAMYGDDDD